MDIRQAEIGDLNDITRLNKIDDYGNPDCYIKDSIKNSCVFVAESDVEIVWFSLYQVIWGNTAFLALVKVHPNYQNQGIWSLLVKTTEDKLKQDGFSSITSSTEDKNTRSQNFHTKLWFVRIWMLDLPHGKEIFYRKEL